MKMYWLVTFHRHILPTSILVTRLVIYLSFLLSIYLPQTHTTPTSIQVTGLVIYLSQWLLLIYLSSTDTYYPYLNPSHRIGYLSILVAIAYLSIFHRHILPLPQSQSPGWLSIYLIGYCLFIYLPQTHTTLPGWLSILHREWYNLLKSQSLCQLSNYLSFWLSCTSNFQLSINLYIYQLSRPSVHLFTNPDFFGVIYLSINLSLFIYLISTMCFRS